MICVNCMFYEAHGADVTCWRCQLLDNDPNALVGGLPARARPLDYLTKSMKKRIDELIALPGFPFLTRKETHGK